MHKPMVIIILMCKVASVFSTYSRKYTRHNQSVITTDCSQTWVARTETNIRTSPEKYVGTVAYR